MDNKLGEWRPSECGTRLGDFVNIDGQVFLKIKCRRCSKNTGKDEFHLVPVDTAFSSIVDVKS